MPTEKKLTGYPSIDKPWLKYYSEEAINAPLPEYTIYEYLWENNKDHLDDIALIYFGKKITYGELFENIDKAARAFAAIGIKNNDIVVLCTLNTPEMIYCTYALNKIGAVPSFEYPTLSDRDMCKAIKEMDVKLLILLDLFIDKYSEACKSAPHIIAISPSESMDPITKFMYNMKVKTKTAKHSFECFSSFIKSKKADFKLNTQHTKTAILVHTGGTTGVPKSVALSDDNFNSVAYQYKISGMDYSRQDTILHCIPPFHAYGFSVGVHMPLTLGMTICMSLKIDNDSIANLFAKIKPNHFVGAGPHVSAIISNKRVEKLNLSHMKTIAIGGAATNDVQESTVNKFLRKHGSHIVLVVGFGMTEACATVCTNMNHCNKTGSVGIPLSKNNIKIINTETQKELPYNSMGELLISSPSVMVEYYQNAEETQKAISFDENNVRWIHTGDLATIDNDGFLFINGRLKRICTTKDNNGMVYKLYPDFIEQTVSQMEEVLSCAAICKPDNKRVNIPILFAVISNKIIENSILDYCKESLPEHMIPEKIIIKDSLPLTTVGKVDYRALEKEAEKL